MKTAAIIVAAGKSQRMNGVDKQFLRLCGKPVIAYVLDAFLSCKDINSIVLVVPDGSISVYRNWLNECYGFYGDIVVTAGGPERQYSVLNGLKALNNEDPDIVVIHDGARPMVTPKLIEDSIEAASKFGAAVAAVPVKDTIKQSDGQHFVERTLSRETLWSIQTPQSFRYDIIMRAHTLAIEQGYLGTDDAVLAERAGYRVKLFMGGYENIKITTPDDVPVAEALLRCDRTYSADNTVYSYRTGTGYDVHRLVEDRPLILGGVSIPFEKGLLGHSDADVLIHAIIDALLGAAALGDIGRHFPDTDDSYKDISSIRLLREVNSLLESSGYTIGNIDATIIAEAPKLTPYIWSMRRCIASGLGLGIGQVSIKATTTEGLGFAGRQEGIAAHATAAIFRIAGDANC
ncbi:2-C-methyl-D-erythritol 4-phosphate cytidylyltransferase [Mahella sp.]|uniref:2-C-methyl-D-erythritol 4-phosphate cytidylyltransferase n=1 Tax=Mahella sp. TaxID=2798721 RepID=UPI0034360F71|nr:2-C-methyl-D-erythritol 4-phosphate cytidylyltransferase [Mahella sp.]